MFKFKSITDKYCEATYVNYLCVQPDTRINKQHIFSHESRDTVHYSSNYIRNQTAVYTQAVLLRPRQALHLK